MLDVLTKATTTGPALKMCNKSYITIWYTRYTWAETQVKASLVWHSNLLNKNKQNKI